MTRRNSLTLEKALTGVCRSLTNGSRYREVLPQLWDCLATRDFIWCCTSYDNTFRKVNLVNRGRTEWEIDVLPRDVFKFISCCAWEDALKTGIIDWNALFVGRPSDSDLRTSAVDALLRFPLRPGTFRCNGLVPLTRNSYG